MHVSFSLSEPPGYPELQRLLPSLMEADKVYFQDSAPQILCRCESAELSLIETAISTALASLGAGWEGHVERPDAVHDDVPLHSYGEAVLTVVAPDGTGLPGELASVLAEWDVELCAIRRLSPSARQGDLAVELYLDSWQRCALELPGLPVLAQRWGVDLALAPADSKRPRRRLFAFDMDSTLIRCEVIDELAKRAGVGAEVAAVTAKAMRGELDFRSSFRERLARLRGLPAAELKSIAADIPLMPGARELLRTLRAQGHYTLILSGGFDYFARHVQQQLGVHEVHANHLEIENGTLTGDVVGDIIDGERKARLLCEIAAARGFDLDDTVAVGDGANDLPMLARAGMGVAFHAKPVVREKARFAMNHSDLDALLYLLGVPRRDP